MVGLLSTEGARMKPHKHPELIKAWADGAEIEYKFLNGSLSGWQPAVTPIWVDDCLYRIKPEPVMSSMQLNLRLQLERSDGIIRVVGAEVLK